jgi:hypothetical protein
VAYLGNFTVGERTGQGVLIELVDSLSNEWMHETNPERYTDSAEGKDFLRMS